MIESVIKRNGRKQKFNKKRVEKSILKAFESLDLKDENNLANKIATEIENLNIKEIDVEEIQDIIEKKLMASSYKDVAKSYITYRYLKELARNQYNDLWDAIADKLQAKNVQNQNANLDEKSFSGRVNEASGVITKKYAIDFLLSDMAKNNHLNNEIYIHDLDNYSVGNTNCLTIPFDDLLSKGFKTKQTDVRPANSVNTAMQLIAVIFQLQSLQQFGGVSASHLDWTMVPYVRKSFFKHWQDGQKYILGNKEADNLVFFKDKSIDDDYYKDGAYEYALDMTKKEIHQAVEGLFHNLNTLQSRSGQQLPFSSINYGTCTLLEGRIIIEELLKVSIEGLGKLHRTSIFPCSIFQYMKGVNDKPGTPNYDLYRLSLESTAKRLYPNYANVDWSVNIGYDKNDPKTYVSTMGCRTYNGSDINVEPGTNPQTKDGRGNACPVTIILPELAMQIATKYKNENQEKIIEEFLKYLDIKLHEAKDMLLERYEWMCSQSPESARFMYENNLAIGYHPEEGIRSALKHFTLVIGKLGLAETLQILIGDDHTSERGMELAKRIEQLYKDRCAEFKKQYHLNFGNYNTPAENLCYTAMKKFKEKWGEIPNISDREYFTNSIHVPVWKNLTPFEKIDIESQLTGYSNAGCITYVELDASCKNNIDALEQIVNYAMEKDIPYFAINVPNDMCLDCGYTDDIGNNCPICGSDKIHRLRRVTGYLSQDYRNFNKGKISETEQRVKHEKVISYEDC